MSTPNAQIRRQLVYFAGDSWKPISLGTANYTYITVINENNTRVEVYAGRVETETSNHPFHTQRPYFQRTTPLEAYVRDLTLHIVPQGQEQTGYVEVLLSYENLNYNGYLGGSEVSEVNITQDSLGLLKKSDLNIDAQKNLHVVVDNNLTNYATEDSMLEVVEAVNNMSAATQGAATEVTLSSVNGKLELLAKESTLQTLVSGIDDVDAKLATIATNSNSALDNDATMITSLNNIRVELSSIKTSLPAAVNHVDFRYADNPNVSTDKVYDPLGYESVTHIIISNNDPTNHLLIEKECRNSDVFITRLLPYQSIELDFTNGMVTVVGVTPANANVNTQTSVAIVNKGGIA